MNAFLLINSSIELNRTISEGYSRRTKVARGIKHMLGCLEYCKLVNGNGMSVVCWVVSRLDENKLRCLCARCHLTRLALGVITSTTTQTHTTTRTHTHTYIEREREANYGRTFELSLRRPATLLPSCECLSLIMLARNRNLPHKLRHMPITAMNS